LVLNFIEVIDTDIDPQRADYIILLIGDRGEAGNPRTPFILINIIWRNGLAQPFQVTYTIWDLVRFFEVGGFTLIAQLILSLNIDKPPAPRYINYTQNLHAVY